MSKVLNQFLDAVGTLRVLEDHGITIKDEGEKQLVPCPDASCGCAARVQGKALVCTSVTCDWRLGNVVDYLGQAKHWSPEDTVDRLYTRYAPLLETLDGLPWLVARPRLLDKLSAHRRLVDFLLSVRGVPPQLIPETAVWIEAYANQDIDLRTQRHTFYVLTQAQCRNLADLVSAVCDDDVTYDYETGATVFVFFSDFLTVSHFQVLPHLSKSNRTCVRWNVAPSRYAFSGLWELRGQLEHVHLVRRCIEAAQLNQRASRLGLAMNYLSLQKSTDWEYETPLRFRQLTYLLDNDEDTRHLAEAKLLGNQLKLGYARAPDTTEDWMDFLNTRWRTALKEGFEDRVKKELSALVITPTERRRWLERDDAPPRLLELLKECANTKQLIFRVRDAVVIETDNGYQVDRLRKGAQPATNFTLQFDSNIYFRDSPEMLHRGAVQFNGQAFPFLLAREDLQRPAQLERSAQFAVNAKQGVRAASTPVVLDKQLAASVVLLLNQRVAELPRMEGVRQLGWSSDRRRFQAPDWSIDGSGLTPRETCADPKSMVLRNYGFNPPPTTLRPAPSPSTQAGELLALLVAQTARVQCGRPASPLPFHDNPENANRLKALFAESFQQHAVVILSYNSRGGTRDIDQLNGYPCLTRGVLAEDYAQRIPHPTCVLAQFGRVLEHSWRPGDLDFIRNVYPVVVQWLLQADASMLPISNTEVYAQDLLLEGVEILRKSINYEWDGEVPATPVLWSRLERYSPASLGVFLQEHFEAQRMIVNTSVCPAALRSRLQAELLSLDATYIGGAFGSLDLLSAQNALRAFYHETPKLPRIGKPTPTLAEWTANLEASA